MTQRGSTGMKVVLGLVAVAAIWWLVKRVWLVKEATEAEPPALSGVAPRPRRSGATAGTRLDPVDEAIAESFPASDPPSFAGARGHGELRA